ncbi:MAG: SDR family NAD(P)-dependent oxidoreductase [Rhodocyclaceae bacterium]|nr:SDR family NAD(P)-dependent oxidoreductase [Rhodocyclaceae bacterium]MBK9624987.1 SDR family NAD(P)-dependent oxidoreductase [Rhodocyclaceae bacterium]MBL0075945.1 SDR family NAD(P)-dependent oxidoreductase [Rhodocyclaceae bacterium]MBP6110568.1 SDR family NAD(P)-dependent oxidoreductase [Rhodocyclaceae bacterium]MBP6278549.1 SDR family NAD(P)-dependent oxidoreductase [Rhodocyclaceae bacterium]
MATKATKTTTTTRRSAPKAKAAPAAKPAAPAAPAASTVKRTARSTRDSVMSTVASVIDANPIGKAVKVTRKVSRAVVKTRRASLLSKAIRNKVVVVTGATAGIGEDAAIKLAKAGAIVILAARTPEKLDATMAKIKADGGKAFAYSCDISDLADCDRFVKTVLDKHGHVDVLVNNAGRSIRRSLKYSFERFHDFERTMQLNYFGAVRLIMGFAPLMLERKSGQIINVSSIGVLTNAPRFAAYVASKAALDAFSTCAASEFSDRKVAFTTIYMPLVATAMTAPTKMYKAFPMLTPDEASEMIVDAVIDRPARIATGLGLAGAVSHALTPKISEYILNQAYNLFPDSAAARGLTEAEAAAEEKKLPKGKVDMARQLFAQVFNGVHW